MDTTALVKSPPIDVGRRTAGAIRNDGKLRAVSVFWWYDDSREEYRLAIASGLYSKKGPRAAYSRIQKILIESDLLGKLPLDQVWAIPRDHWTVKAFRSTGDRSQETRYTGCYMNGVFVQDAYIYFLKSQDDQE